jgi:hypothetical protein
VAATQTTIDLAKFILSAGVIDFARFNAIFGLDGGSRSSFMTIVAPRFIGKADIQS